MRRRAPQAPHAAGTERWLVSYADFVTLLFAFFVVLYAHSKTDMRQAQQIAQSFREAAGNEVLSRALARLIGHPGTLPPESQLREQLAAPASPPAGSSPNAELLPSMDRLQKDLSRELKDGRLEIRMERRGMVISLRESSFFPSGEKNVLPAARRIVDLIAASLRPLPNPIRLEGHTDAVPIHNSRFRSNWELSAARSIALMELFTEDLALPRERLSIAGFADTAPIATNETEEGRARNRRVDIVVLTVEGAVGEPAHYGAKPPAPIPLPSASPGT
jgi:chemotaxis protein MotB